MFKFTVPFLSILLLPIFLLSACATTQGSTAAQATQKTSPPIVFDGIKTFIDLEDGGKYQDVTGLNCPGEFLGNKLINTYSYNDDATDVSCNYKSENGYSTVYLSYYPDTTLDYYFSSAVYSVPLGNLKGQVELDKEKSESCMLSSQLMTGLAGLLTERNKTNTINIDPSGSTGHMPFKAAVFNGDDLSSYVAVSPAKGKFMKIRHTVKQPISDGDDTDVCLSLHGIMRDLIASVGTTKWVDTKAGILGLMLENES